MNCTLPTVVVGAGPAGLLFALLSRILLGQRSGSTTSWPMLVIDKRGSYTRSHQLALDRRAYYSIRDKISDQSFDSFIGFLETWNFRVPVNTLEQFLFDLLSGRDVIFENFELREDNLNELFGHIPGLTHEAPPPWLTVVGADSVRSIVRDRLFEGNRVERGAHHFLARLIIRGKNLPEQLSILDHIRLSKFISSFISYRYNPNGYAEMDLFLNEREFSEVLKLGATPKEGYQFKPGGMPRIRAPLFNDFVALALDFIKDDPEASICLQSTFKLEHAISEQRFQIQAECRRLFFLVGDSAIALPYQRGMSALVQAAYELAVVHDNIHRALSEGKEGAVCSLASVYQKKTEEILSRELLIVKGRTRLVEALTYVSRISAMVPFPMQSMLSIASVRSHESRWRFGTADGINLFLALSSSAALSAPIIVWPAIGENIFSSIFVITALVIQFVGGMFYRFALTLNSFHYWSKVFWRTQIVIWLVLGIGGSLRETLSLGRLHGWSYATLWWVGGVVFAIGLMLSDRFIESALEE